MTALISTRSKAFRATWASTKWNAVCLIGWEGPRPAYFGDNQGILPCRIATSTKETVEVDRVDLDSPHVGIVIYETVMVPSATHAKRLKDALDEILMGQQEEQENSGLRHRWRNLRHCWEQDDADEANRDHSRAMWWAIILDEARRVLSAGAVEFPIFGQDEVYAMISRRVLKGQH